MVWKCRLFVKIAMLIQVFHSARCFPGGGPDTACSTMYPLGHGAEHRRSRPPYRIRTAKNAYSAGETIPVIIESLGEAAFFRGVYMQARPAGCATNTSRPVGVFTYGGTDLQTRHCFDMVHSTVTQKSRKKKISSTIYWTAPVISVGHVIFQATFVQDAHTFWINVTSEVLRDLKDPGLPGCIKETTSTLSTTFVVSNGTTFKQRHFAHVRPTAATYSASSSHWACAVDTVAMTIILLLHLCIVSTEKTMEG